jgi:uncharacterized membrane protein
MSRRVSRRGAGIRPSGVSSAGSDTAAACDAESLIVASRRPEAGVNKTIAWVLTVGLAAAIALMVTGAVLAGIRSTVAIPHQTSFGQAFRSLERGEPGGFFQLGLIMMLATPVARVVALLLAYARRRQWFFAGISLFVLCVLVLSGYLGLTFA